MNVVLFASQILVGRRNHVDVILVHDSHVFQRGGFYFLDSVQRIQHAFVKVSERQ
jgi:hypothetical protein